MLKSELGAKDYEKTVARGQGIVQIKAEPRPAGISIQFRNTMNMQA